MPETEPRPGYQKGGGKDFGPHPAGLPSPPKLVDRVAEHAPELDEFGVRVMASVSPAGGLTTG